MSSLSTDALTLHALLEDAPGVIALIDGDMDILSVNRTVAGHQVEDRVGTSYRALLSPSQIVEVEAAVARARDSGQPQRIESFVDVASGSRRWYSTLVAAIGGDEGSPREFAIVTTEITAHKATQEELSRVRGELLEVSRRAGMAEIVTGVLHNVGNVLNSVGVSVSSVARALESSRLPVLPRIAGLLEDHADRIGQFVTEDPRGRKLPALVRQLSDELMVERERVEASVARLCEHLELMRVTIDAQQTVAKTEGRSDEVEPRGLVEQTLSMFRIKLEQRAIEVSVRCEIPGPLVLDRASTLQILANLVLNAIEALEVVEDRPRRLAVRVGPREEWIDFEVEDNGQGIPPPLLPQIFEHGFTTKASGHGFGLHFCAVTAGMMKGSLAAHSEGPGRGSLFRLSVPRARP